MFCYLTRLLHLKGLSHSFICDYGIFWTGKANMKNESAVFCEFSKFFGYVYWINSFNT